MTDLFLKKPPAPPLVTLPRDTDPTTADLVMEAVLSPFGLGTDTRDLPPDAARRLTRAQAAGDLVPVPAIMVAPRLAKPVLQQLLRTGSSKIDSAVDYFINRYPRLMSHVNSVRAKDWLDVGTTAQMRPRPLRPGRPVADIEYDASLANPTYTQQPVEVLGHELSHVAQWMRNPKAVRKAYSSLGELNTIEEQQRYVRLPFEQEAEISGLRQQALQRLQAAAAAGQPALPGTVSGIGRAVRFTQPLRVEDKLRALDAALRRPDIWKNARTPLQRQLPFTEKD